jgi:hypothetical protein
VQLYLEICKRDNITKTFLMLDVIALLTVSAIASLESIYLRHPNFFFHLSSLIFFLITKLLDFVGKKMLLTLALLKILGKA